MTFRTTMALAGGDDGDDDCEVVTAEGTADIDCSDVDRFID